MSKEQAITLCVLTDWRESTRGKGKLAKTFKFRWVVQADARNWSLAIEREGRDPVGEKFCKSIEHMCGNFVFPAMLDPYDCVKAIKQALEAAFIGDAIDKHLFKQIGCTDSKGRATHPFIEHARLLDEHYRLNFALADHDGVFERLGTSHGHVAKALPIVCDARAYNQTRVAALAPVERVRNDPSSLAKLSRETGALRVQRRERGLFAIGGKRAAS